MTTLFEGFKPASMAEVEMLGKKRLSKHTLWAEDAIGAFLDMTEEAVEITQWPEGKNASQIASCLKSNLSRLNRTKDIRIKQHEGRVFMIRQPKAGKVVSMPDPSKRRIPMPQSSAGLKRGCR